MAWDDRSDRAQALESAREAARRSGLTLGQWLDTVVRASTAESAAPPLADAFTRPLEKIGARLSELAERLERITPARPAAEPASEPPVRLTHALDELNTRLDELLRVQVPPPQRPSPAAARPASAPIRTPPAAPTAEEIEQAVAEIVARQRALEAAPPPPPEAFEPAPPPLRIEEAVPAPPPAVQAPDLSALQEQLRQLTTQIESLHRPCGVESAIEALRSELADIWRTVTEAMPRRALEALEAEVRALSTRLDSERHRPDDAASMEGLARGLAEVRDALQALMPAEGLAGLEQTIKALARKIDALAESGIGDTALQQMQTAIAGLRDVVAGAASSEALTALMAEVHGISAKIERLLDADARPGVESISQRLGVLSDKVDRAGGDDLAARIQRGTDAIAAKIDQFVSAGVPPGMESISGQLSALSKTFEQSGVNRLAIEQLESNIRGLVEQLTSCGPPQQTLAHIERSISNLAVQLGEARINAVDAAERAAKAVVHEVMSGQTSTAPDDVHALKHDISELRAHQSASDEGVQTALEAVNRTLERLVERLASLEANRRAELQAATAEPRPPAPILTDHVPPMGAAAPAVRGAKPEAPPKAPGWKAREPRPIDPTLPADTPLEPGTVSPRVRGASLLERAAEAVSAPAMPKADQPVETRREAAAEPVSKSSFIAAARRAAQAAQAEGSALAAMAGKSGNPVPSDSPSFLVRSRRPILIALGVLLLVASTVQLVTTLIGRNAPGSEPAPANSEMSTPAWPVPPPATNGAGAPTVTPPSDPTPGSGSNKQSGLAPVTRSVPTAIPPAGALGSNERMPFAPAGRDRPGEATGTVPTPNASIVPPAQTFEADSILPGTGSPASRGGANSSVSPAEERLPAAIGSQTLRVAAENGDAAAEYEIGVRYADGRGVAQNLPEAIRWFERAAERGLAPAQYRLGSMYEKGQGAKKNAEAARRLYTAASDKGNAKAMHNLAVLHAEGVDGKSDYRAAARWFRRAADRGIGDSQYNLGILYARGIGVEQNLAESYKWFSLAAAQGDRDAGNKREEVAQRLDPQSLVAARLAVQTWTAQPQPEDAIMVKAPGAGAERPRGAPARGKALPAQRKS